MVAEALVAQLCLTLCDSMDCCLPDSSVRGILQARIREWWPFPSPGDLPDPGIEPGSPELQADSLPSEPPGNTGHNIRRFPESGTNGHWDWPDCITC